MLHEPRVAIKNFVADDIPGELKRLDDAIAAMRSDVDVMLERGEIADGGEHKDVLETYRMFAHDRGWMQRMRRGDPQPASPPKPASSGFSPTPARA